MPLGPLHDACVQPAPKSRFVVSGLQRTKIKIKIKINGNGNGNGNGNATVKAEPVAVRLAGGCDLEGVTAGKPDCLDCVASRDS
jgi:hypothetical protein